VTVESVAGLDIEQTQIAEVKILKPRRFGDARGWFCEIWNERRLSEAGIEARFVQDNMAYSEQAGTIRGLHFQKLPHAQAKLVGVARGAVLDVAVDVRVGSPTFGRHASATLTAEGGEQLWVPIGFAHGYCTLTSDTLVYYKVTDYYHPASEGGVHYDDPTLGVSWPVQDAIVAEKDQRLPSLVDMPPAFTYGDHT
jgi:dTDP-4-dehydrorhamnose 3,5-epimerase